MCLVWKDAFFGAEAFYPFRLIARALFRKKNHEEKATA